MAGCSSNRPLKIILVAATIVSKGLPMQFVRK
jgi:hypothetical protein